MPVSEAAVAGGKDQQLSLGLGGHSALTGHWGMGGECVVLASERGGSGWERAHVLTGVRLTYYVLRILRTTCAAHVLTGVRKGGWVHGAGKEVDAGGCMSA